MEHGKIILRNRVNKMKRKQLQALLVTVQHNEHNAY